MGIQDALTSKNPSELQALKSSMDSLSSIFLIIAVVLALLFVIWLIKRKYTANKAQPKQPPIARTAFTSSHFGVVYDNGQPEDGELRYALICNGKGEELCRYEEVDGQIIRGFSSENGLLYMHTIETDDNGAQISAKWLFMPEENELVECD